MKKTLFPSKFTMITIRKRQSGPPLRSTVALLYQYTLLCPTRILKDDLKMKPYTTLPYTNVARQFLKKKFWGRVISRRNEIIWSAPHSPNLNPLDFWFWGYVESQLIRNIKEMKVAVKGFQDKIPPTKSPRKKKKNVFFSFVFL